ncbi:hypothetical protein DAEQUDRAFT_727209 [Daedalea quercina L-15889]|uniref:Uncharacterized protein n=1 Tax=Daedalea quercina L-15889 TaxID=1314783 RepID=A0A165Q5C0_9APHY|nr:hypothetical protein DAEQUDRAFT_727209 [Daedalea quercina L-15889]
METHRNLGEILRLLWNICAPPRSVDVRSHICDRTSINPQTRLSSVIERKARTRYDGIRPERSY